MTAIGRWAMPSTSRITPPTPVFAPPNGSTADGWLWVSAFRAIVTGLPRASSRKPTMPALPTNADRTNGAAIDSVHSRSMPISDDRSTPSSVVRCARNVLCAQCSLHVCASVSSSTSVGSRPSPAKCACTTSSSSGSSASLRSVPIATSSSSDRPAIATTSALPVRVLSAWSTGSTVPVVQRSITGLATTRRTTTSASASSTDGPNSTRRPVAAPVTASPSCVAACNSDAAAVSVTPGRKVTSTPGAVGSSQVAVCSKRVGEEPGEHVEVGWRRGRPRRTRGRTRRRGRDRAGRPRGAMPRSRCRRRAGRPRSIGWSADDGWTHGEARSLTRS